MKTPVSAGAGLLFASAILFTQMPAARAEMMKSVPPDNTTVTNWYKQDVYDPSNTSIGKIMDVLVSPSGQVSTAIIGVGGFLGAGEKDVAVSFPSIKRTMKDNKVYLTLDTTKDALKAAPGFKYDSDKTRWIPEEKK
jgi:PRC-barrel domain